MGYETITTPLASTPGTIGGLWANKISNLLSGVDVSSTDATNQPSIATPTRFSYQALRIWDSATSKHVILQGPGPLDVNKTVVIPTMPVGTNSDVMQLLNTQQSPTNKIFDLSVNLLTETGKATGALLKHDGTEYTGLARGTANQILITNAAGTDVAWATVNSTNLPNVSFTNQAATFTAMQTFKDNLFQIQNPAGTFALTFRTSAQVANRDVLIPLLTSNGTFCFDNFTNVFTAIQSFANNLVLNNNIVIQAKDSGGNARQMCKIDTSNNLYYGDSAGIISLFLFSGNGAAAMKIDSGNLVQISPAWAVPLVLNSTIVQANNTGFLIKTSGGTNITAAYMSAGNLLSFGDVGSNNINTSIWAGQSVAAIALNNTNQATFTKMAQAGVFEQLATFTVSDNTASFLRLENNTNVDGQFSPIITANISSALATSARAFYLRAIIDPTLDTGATSVIGIEARIGGGLIVNRPLLDVTNFTTQVFRINAKGDQLVTVIAQTGVTEILATWTVSDDPNSAFKILNAYSTDAIFGVRLQAVASSASGAGTRALYMQNYINTANDSGTASVMAFDARLSNDTPVLVRPLFQWYNATTEVMKIDAKGVQTNTTIAQAGVWEDVAYYKISDNLNSFLRIVNQSGSDGRFVPTIQGLTDSTVTNAMGAFYLQGSVHSTLDTGSVPAVILRGNIHSADAVLATRPVLGIENYTTRVLTVNSKGDLKQTIIAQAGVGEVLHEWTVSDFTTSYLRLRNFSSTDAQFVPNLMSVNALGNASFPGFILHGYIATAWDSGTEAAMIFDSRKIDESALVTRPSFKFRTAGTNLLEMFTTYFNFQNLELRNAVGSSSMSKIEGWQTLKRTGHLNGGCAVNAEFGTGLFAPKGLGFYGPAIGGSMLGTCGTYTGYTASVNNASGVFGYKCGMNSRRDRLVKMSIRARIDRQSASRFFIVLKSVTTQITAGTQTPIGTAEGGIAIGWNELSGNYRVWTCDALGTVTNTDTGLAIPAWGNAVEYLDLEVDSAGTTWTWTVWNDQHTAKLGSGTVTATVPTISHLLHFHIHGEITDATMSTFVICSGDIETTR